jgi:hypothetical protein
MDNDNDGRCWFRRLCWLLFFGWLAWLVLAIGKLCRLKARERVCGQTVPPWAYRQPDPLIYSQQYLQSLGLAVTWDNPDIHLESPDAPGVPVDAHTLKPDTVYNVIAQIWNGSTTAPAVGMPVNVSYLAFGIGTTKNAVGSTIVDLGVKGSADSPAFATVPWRTPATPGHYCLQVELVWADDENPANNMGQSNTDVKPLNSPHAAFVFPLHNNAGFARTLRLEADAYEVPPLEPCSAPGEQQRLGNPQQRLRRHDRAAWPIPAGWRIDMQPNEVQLAPNDSVQVNVDIISPDGYRGRQAINVHAFDCRDLVGGVTLYVEGNG